MYLKKENVEFYKIGTPCIIEVNDVNSPRGWWWGTIIEHKILDDGNIDVIAKITGGKFQTGEYGKPIYSDENKDRIPVVNYIVHPNPFMNGYVNLLSRFLRQEDEFAKLRQNYHWLKELHIASKK